MFERTKLKTIIRVNVEIGTLREQSFLTISVISQVNGILQGTLDA